MTPWLPSAAPSRRRLVTSALSPPLPLAVVGAACLLACLVAAPAPASRDTPARPPATPAEVAAWPQIESDALIAAISPATGAIAGVWDRRLDRRVVACGDDRYRVERRDGSTEASERDDRVVSLQRQGRRRVVARCRNRRLDDLIITKTYRFGDSAEEISKTVAFESASGGGCFILYFTALTLDPAFRAGGHFDLHAADHLGAGEPTFDHRGLDRIVAQYRYRVNGRHVTTVTGFNFSDEDAYTEDGWLDPVFADHLGAQTQSSAEVRTLVLAGDEFDYYAWYDGLPEVRRLYDIDVSDWFWKTCRMDAMYFGRNDMDAVADVPCMTTRWNLNLLWGDYFSEGDLVMGSRDQPRPTVPAAKVAAENHAFSRSVPHWRMSMYTWLWTVARSSRTFADHPEFLITTRDGGFDESTWRHDVTGDRSYLKQLRGPGCREYFLDQYRRHATTMGAQFVYIDGCPIGISRLDWKLETVQQTYDWLDYFRDVRRTIRDVHPDGFLFVNNPNQPFADGGYFEDHRMAEHMRADWRKYARKLMIMKFRERPRRWHALLYWTEASKPLYSNYTLGLGFTYSNGGTEWHAATLHAWVDAAWELRGSRMVMAVASPRYWREPTDYEVYALRKGEQGMVSVISHAEATAVVPVVLDAEAMGLDPAGPVYVWQLRMRDTRGAKAWAEPPAHCFEKVFLGTKHVRDGRLRLDVEARPLLLELLVLTRSPVWFTHVGGETLRTVQNNLLTASISDPAADGRTLRVEVERGPATLFLLEPEDAAAAVRLDQNPCPSRPARLGNVDGLAVEVARGTHVLTIR